MYNIYEAFLDHQDIVFELLARKSIGHGRRDSIASEKQLKTFNLPGFIIHHGMALLRRGVPGIGGRTRRDEKVQNQMLADMEHYQCGMRLSTFWNEKCYAILGVKPDFLVHCLRVGGPDEPGIARFDLKPIHQYVMEDGQKKLIAEDDPYHYMDYEIRMLSLIHI